MVEAFTDYPIACLGDAKHRPAPICKCVTLTWDRSKYCDVLVYFMDQDGDPMGYVTSFKRFYLYKNETRYEPGIKFSDEELSALPWGLANADLRGLRQQARHP